MISSQHDNTSTTRTRLREARRALSVQQQADAAEDLLYNLLELHIFRRAGRVACYLATDGEIDTSLVMDWLLAHGKSCYLPVLSHINGNRLLFAQVNYGTEMVTNRYGIPEPDIPLRKLVRPTQLDLVLLPLVAFDTQGNRVGMGGGYYDRTLQVRRNRHHWLKPHLVGVAHDLQKQKHIQPNHWDVPLEAIVTDERIYLAPGKN